MSDPEWVKRAIENERGRELVFKATYGTKAFEKMKAEIARRADHKDTTEPEPCPHCKGEHWFGNYDHPDHCPVCGGSGVVTPP